MLSAVLTVQILGDHLRSGGSIVTVVPEHPREGSAEAAVKAAIVELDRRPGRRTSAPAASPSTPSPPDAAPSRATTACPSTPPPVAAEIARLALFLTTPAARHITGQTLHVSHGALANFG